MLIRIARCCASRCPSIASSSRRSVRPAMPYARITGAPTTLSPIAPSSVPVRWRTVAYAAPRRRCNCRMTNTAGRNAASTTRVNCQEYASMTAVVTTS